ncbi:MAG: TonB-dependent receptor plug domain-containing protein [Gammaproteobacteria bacterium]|nr:TonB-dependent receptor plug domain-containing protein [Gammaproteobacteria bacterium]
MPVCGRPRFAILVTLATVCAGTATATADPDDDVEELVVTADLDSLPDDEMRTVFGFGRSLLDTPRSASTVSDEMMARFNIRDIDELIALAPGSFTQSFFGVAGTLDIRGTTGETYFRGIRRLDNPGNYPTPIGASERVDIVRGPASPIHGPAKIGGYLNFNPKSARIEATGEFIEEATGSAGVDFGSWGRRIATAEVGGPGRLGSEDFGYWLYAEAEDSGSYYDHGDISQTLIQASFDMDVGAVGLQFGGMYHEFTGTENAGWNRLTQDLIDTGTYITGSPKPLDTNGDGRISHQEFDVDGNGFTDLNPFAAGLKPGTTAQLGPGPFPGACSIGTTTLFGCRPDLLLLDNVGTAAIEGSQVLIAAEDELANEVLTLYFDVVGTTAGGWEWRNQAFYESYDNVNEVAYGFSSFHDAAVFEDKLVLAKRLRRGGAEATVQFSPSVRVTDFDHGDDFTNEYFDRRDLTKPASALDRRLLATQIDDDYSRYHVGDYVDLGLAVLVDADWRRLNMLAGVRYDSIAFESRQPVDKLLLPSATHFCLDASCVVAEASDRVDAVSWTLSLSLDNDAGIIPYVTMSSQGTVIAGQGADIAPANVADGTAFDHSTLREVGVKASVLDERLYLAAAVYEQERTDYSAQSVDTNQAAQTTGAEFEARWAVNDRLLFSLGYSRIEVVNLNTLNAGGRFSFIGADDIPGVPPEAFYGGALGGSIVKPGRDGARRAGIPENIVSLTGTYAFGNGLAVSASVVDVDAVHSGFANSVRLPAYTLVNAGFVFERGNWTLSATAKNLSDERYFRANFPNLFGGVIVLPELPRHVVGRLQYRW